MCQLPLQVLIMLTGNYNWFNFHTALLLLPAWDADADAAGLPFPSLLGLPVGPHPTAAFEKQRLKVLPSTGTSSTRKFGRNWPGRAADDQTTLGHHPMA